MGEISRTALFGKLDGLAYQAIESATVFCRMRGNPYVELSHWFNQILQLQDSDLHHVMQRFEMDPGRLAGDLTRSLDALPRGASSVSDLSSHVEDAVERAWVWATLRFGEPFVRTGHIVVGMLKSPGLRNLLPGISREFAKVRVDTLIDEWEDIVGGSPEAGQLASDGTRFGGDTAPEGAPAAEGGVVSGKQEALERFTVDLSEQARQGHIDPVVGRDEEIRQMIDILMRRRQNNPILTGEAGVGKTAVVEGFARRIADGDVPPALRSVALRALDVGLLQAGASMKGEFENRLRQVIDEVQASERPIVLFIDEAHTLVGAGGAAGTGDAANLLKPALARGTLRTIGATTWAEYKKYIEKDPALSRRFQAVQVSEPEEARAVAMIRSMATALEAHHRVQLRDEALSAAVRLSSRYIPARQLPDKAVSLLDTACARVAVSQHGVPAEVEDCRRRIETLQTESEILARERAVGMDTGDRETGIEEELALEREHLAELESDWQREKDLVDRILELRAELREAGQTVATEDDSVKPAAAPEVDAAAIDGPSTDAVEGEQQDGSDSRIARLRELQAELEAMQGERPLILPGVDAQAVASVVADWTGIPVGRMVRDEIAAVLSLTERLAERVKGQDHALEMITRRVQTARASLDNPGKPVGVFMLAGPSGVGKTETALALAESLYGGEHNVITINMSEFQEAHTVSTLKGAPPGYVGYGEGGVLTEAVRRKPYSVILLDEVEKAHPDVHEIFFQVFDKGRMEDGEGRLIDFKNTLIILTTNVGTDMIMRACEQGQQRPDAEDLAGALRRPLLEVFPPALLGRIVTIPYYPLSDDMLKDIIRLQLGRISTRVQENHQVPFAYAEAVVDLVLQRCTELESGGRMIDAILTNSLLPDLSREFLTRLMDHRTVERVHVDVADAEFRYVFE